MSRMGVEEASAPYAMENLLSARLARAISSCRIDFQIEPDGPIVIALGERDEAAVVLARLRRFGRL